MPAAKETKLKADNMSITECIVEKTTNRNSCSITESYCHPGLYLF